MIERESLLRLVLRVLAYCQIPPTLKHMASVCCSVFASRASFWRFYLSALRALASREFHILLVASSPSQLLRTREFYTILSCQILTVATARGGARDFLSIITIVRARSSWRHIGARAAWRVRNHWQGTRARSESERDCVNIQALREVWYVSQANRQNARSIDDELTNPKCGGPMYQSATTHWQ